MTVTRLMCEDAIDNFIYSLDEGVLSKLGKMARGHTFALQLAASAFAGNAGGFVGTKGSDYATDKIVGSSPSQVSSPDTPEALPSEKEKSLQKRLRGEVPTENAHLDTMMSINAGDLKSALTHAARTQSHSIRNQTLANIPATKNTKLSFSRQYFDKSKKYNAAGAYYPFKDIININPTVSSDHHPYVVSHEAIHASVTGSQILNALKSDAWPNAKKEAKQNPELANEYGMSNYHEFLAELGSNKNFAQKLNKIKTNNSSDLGTVYGQGLRELSKIRDKKSLK